MPSLTRKSSVDPSELFYPIVNSLIPPSNQDPAPGSSYQLMNANIRAALTQNIGSQDLPSQGVVLTEPHLTPNPFHQETGLQNLQHNTITQVLPADTCVSHCGCKQVIDPDHKISKYLLFSH